LKEKQSCLSSKNTEDVSSLALLQAVLKCKTGVGVKNFSPGTKPNNLYSVLEHAEVY